MHNWLSSFQLFNIITMLFPFEYVTVVQVEMVGRNSVPLGYNIADHGDDVWMCESEHSAHAVYLLGLLNYNILQ